MNTDKAYFSRPGSAYVFKTPTLRGGKTQHNYQVWVVTDPILQLLLSEKLTSKKCLIET